MHNDSDYRNLILDTADKDALKWRAYAQLGAMLIVYALALVIAFSVDGARVEEGGEVQLSAATTAQATEADREGKQPAGAPPEQAASADAMRSAKVSTDLRAAAQP